ncbi:sugar phosphate isomerase/epimerase [Algoriphagus halophilus]|uniref:sugar phosphate isomerase/epimerase family protein n=1 Tax=Algoriphagus halophilus TaxID=226505 RepID=UPI00358E3B95
MKRRNFLASLPLLASIDFQKLGIQNESISSNGYNWFTFYRRDGKIWGENWNRDMKLYAQSGLKSFEPGIESLEMLEKLIPAMKENQIAMPSLYANSVLHEQSQVKKSIQSILEIAAKAVGYGCQIIVTNPSPIDWNNPINKSDSELITQAKAMDQLGKELKDMGMTLAYHTHDMELRAGAREIHHTLQNTDPEYVSFCFDTHWVFRGSDNSQLAVFDILKMYGDRIVELHLRQSTGGIWSESFTAEGDIDYLKFSSMLKQKNIRPHLVIEQCLEAQSPRTLDVVTAHRKDLEVVKNLFA